MDDVEENNQGDKLKLNIKLANKTFEVECFSNQSILDLKTICQPHCEAEPASQRLIYKGRKIFKMFPGRILKDNDSVVSYKISNGDSVHLVVKKAQQAPTQSQSQPQPSTSTPETSSQNTGVPPNMTTGGFGLLNQMGFAPPSGNNNTGNTGNMGNMMQNPMFQNMMTSVSRIEIMIR